MTKKVTKKKAATKKKAPPVAPSTATEQAMRTVQKAIAGKKVISLDDLNAFLASMAGPGLSLLPADAELSQKQAAQELAFDAMEAESESQARKLAKRALAKDPDCLDALVLLTSLDAKSPREAIEGLQKAVAAGERSLGATFIRENKGDFWGILETRPYMRALAELANLLRGQGIYLDAIRHYEKMLELNPGDNQGVRDPLLGLYLAVSDLEGAGKLLKKYKEDSMANFAWGRVLERFLAGDLGGAEAALKAARKANGHMELYMSGRKALPKYLPGSYSPGSEEEAILCLDTMTVAWAAHEDALFWMMERLMAEQVQPTSIQSGRKKTPSSRRKPQ
jgi:tetratricopeptide (TPR) repeat protein